MLHLQTIIKKTYLKALLNLYLLIIYYIFLSLYQEIGFTTHIAMPSVLFYTAFLERKYFIIKFI